MIQIKAHVHYDAGTRAEPPLFSDIRDDGNSRSEIDFCIKKDIIWSLAGSISGSIAGSELPKLVHGHHSIDWFQIRRVYFVFRSDTSSTTLSHSQAVFGFHAPGY